MFLEECMDGCKSCFKDCLQQKRVRNSWKGGWIDVKAVLRLQICGGWAVYNVNNHGVILVSMLKVEGSNPGIAVPFFGRQFLNKNSMRLELQPRRVMQLRFLGSIKVDFLGGLRVRNVHISMSRPTKKETFREFHVYERDTRQRRVSQLYADLKWNRKAMQFNSQMARHVLCLS